MEIIKLLKESFNIFLKNLVAYIVGVLIVVVGSLLIVTLPPLIFGLYNIGLKGVKGEKVDFKDVLKGFSFFKTSWIYAIIIIALIGVPAILLTILGMVLGNILIIFALLGVCAIWCLIVGIAQVYSIPLIISKKLGVIEGIKSSISLVKSNLVSSILLVVAVGLISMVLSIIPLVGAIVADSLMVIAVSKAALELKK